MPVLGDLGAYLLPFEVTLTVKRKTGVTNTDGYITPTLAASETFKGVILPITHWISMELGVHERGDSILYVRMSQDNYPSLSIEDIVTDSGGNQWKIIRDSDYENVGNVTLFTVQKLT